LKKINYLNIDSILPTTSLLSPAFNYFRAGIQRSLNVLLTESVGE